MRGAREERLPAVRQCTRRARSVFKRSRHLLPPVVLQNVPQISVSTQRATKGFSGAEIPSFLYRVRGHPCVFLRVASYNVVGLIAQGSCTNLPRNPLCGKPLHVNQIETESGAVSSGRILEFEDPAGGTGQIISLKLVHLGGRVVRHEKSHQPAQLSTRETNDP